MLPNLRVSTAVPVLALVLSWPVLAQAPAEPAPMQETQEIQEPAPAPPPENAAAAQAPAPVETPEMDAGVWEPDRPEPDSVEKIREYTTAPEFLPETVSYVPDSDMVPSPTKFLGHLAGAPDELSRVAQVHGYFRALDEASDRV